MKLIRFVSVSRGNAAGPAWCIVRRFLSWSQAAADEQRVIAAIMLARAYLWQGLSDELRRELETCLTIIVEDSSNLVRCALAEALADAKDAPRHIILALADDQPEIASLVLARSPVFCEAELKEYAALGDDDVQMALARRPRLPASVAASLANFGRREAVIALIENRQTQISPSVIRQIADRFIGDGAVRQALLTLPNLPAAVRYDLAEATIEAQSCLVARIELVPARSEKKTREARERYVIQVASLCEPGQARDFVRHLRMKRALTAALLMRALVSGSRTFFEAAASELSGLGPERVAGLVRDPLGTGFAALYSRMGLPTPFLAPFRATLDALEEFGCEGAGLASRPIASRVIGACERLASPEIGRLIAFLHRLEMEAAMGEARAFRKRLSAELVGTS